MRQVAMGTLFALGLALAGAGCGEQATASAGALPVATAPAAERAEPGGCGPEAEGSCGEAHQATAVGQRLDVGDLTDAWLSGTTDDAEKLAVIVFWEVWCPHCQREMPELVEVDAIEGVQVIGLTRLTRGATEEQVRKFVADHGIDYAIGKDTRGLADRVGVRGVPAAVVVRGGEILWQGHPAKLTDEQLRGWL
jgi:thiol-disulfide isomerase/thioredoxin